MKHFSRFLSEYISAKEQVLYFSVKDSNSFKLRIEIKKKDELRIKASLVSILDSSPFIEKEIILDKSHMDSKTYKYSIKLIRDSVMKLVDSIQNELKQIQENITLDKDSLEQIK